MNGRDSTADRATRPLLPNMAVSTAHTEGDHGLDHEVHTTDTEQPEHNPQDPVHITSS